MKTNRLLYILIVFLALWCLILSSQLSAVSSREDANVINQYEVNGFSTDLTKVVEEIKPSIVTVLADNNILSGFVYKQEGENVYILTAYHGVSNVSNITVRFGSAYQVPGELLGHDIYCDLALIRINTPYEIAPLKLGDSSMLKQGEFLISVGTPLSLDFQGSCQLSMVAGKDMQIENAISVDEERYSYFLNVIEISDPLAQGYSGSPLVNMNGEAVGITSMSAQGGISFAVTVNEAKMAADRMLAGAEIDRNFFGIKGSFLKDMYNYEKTNLNISIETIDGIYVERVRENGLAYAAGIRQGDVVTRINEENISDLNSYLRAVYADAPVFTFEYIRGGETLTGTINND